MTRQRELALKAARARFWSRVTRALWTFGAGLGVSAIAAEWAGFGGFSGPMAIAALGALLSAFALFSNLPAATEGDDWTNTPNVSGNTDND